MFLGIPLSLSQTSISAAAFSPEALSSLMAYSLDGGDAYESTALQNYQVLRSLESYGDYRAPRQGRCWLFDGASNHAATAARVSSGAMSAFSFGFWTKTSFPASLATVAYEATDSITEGWIIQRAISSSGTIRLTFGGSAPLASGISSSGAVSSTWKHFFFVFDGSGATNADRLKLYINGELHALTYAETIPASVISHTSNLKFGAYAGSGQFASGSYRDIRYYSVAKSEAEVAAIMAGDVDTTGLLAHYPCNEESGTVGYDISVNGNHLTLTNITQATFHATDTGVTANRNNSDGYRLSSGVYIPKRLSDNLAADGNALTVTGQAPYPVRVDTPCVTGDGSGVYVNCGSPLANATDFSVSFWAFFPGVGFSTIFSTGTSQSSPKIVIYSDGSGNITTYGYSPDGGVTGAVSFNQNAWNYITLSRTGTAVTLTCNGVASSVGTFAPSLANEQTQLLVNTGTQHSDIRIADLRITTGGVTKYFPLQDGPGSSNTNRNVAWVASDGTGGVISNAIVNGTVANIWANRVPGYIKDHCIQYGGGIAANGAFVPGMPDSANDAAGNAKTLTAGKFGNPYSRINMNPFTAAEYNGYAVPTEYPNLPCVTGVMGTMYVTLGDIGIPATGDWSITTKAYIPTPTGQHIIFGDPSGLVVYYATGLNQLFIWNYNTSAQIPLGGVVVFQVGVWFDLYFARSGSTLYLGINGVNQSGILNSSAVMSNFYLLSGGSSNQPSDASLSDFRVATSGVTTHFPLTDGSDRDLAWYKTDGTNGVVSNAIVNGSLSSIWANKAQNASPFAMQAIVPRNTKFRRTLASGDDRFIILDQAATGGDLTNIEEYVA